MKTEFTGGLTKTSKMPGASFSLPALACKTGGKLNKLPGSVCNGCYARKGFYRMPSVEKAQEDGLIKLHAAMVNQAQRAAWIDEMVENIKRTKGEHFRWHDSGDLQGTAHAEMIAEVARRTPEKKHWIPTKEYQVAAAVRWPENVVVRKSSYMVNQSPGENGCWAVVYDREDKLAPGAHKCPSPGQGGKCGECRACWDGTVKVVAYHKH